MKVKAVVYSGLLKQRKFSHANVICTMAQSDLIFRAPSKNFKKSSLDYEKTHLTLSDVKG